MAKVFSLWAAPVITWVQALYFPKCMAFGNSAWLVVMLNSFVCESIMTQQLKILYLYCRVFLPCVAHPRPLDEEILALVAERLGSSGMSFRLGLYLGLLPHQIDAILHVDITTDGMQYQRCSCGSCLSLNTFLRQPWCTEFIPVFVQVNIQSGVPQHGS